MSAYRSRGVVRFSETDASGRFHHTSALRWAEDTEHELYRAAGVPAVRFPRRAVSATFERPFAHGDDYVVELQVQKLGSSSVTYAWRILAGDDVAVTGSHTVVHLDESGRPAPVPDPLRVTLDALTAEAR
ncbi:thioesterase family protein [Geodermatophilus sp. TF02-6]|uniref:acyl-CoA thioesterase n=1 Tax=Geodermatophilus sp. TF02-6 TaxID=2250575 RepID=UPI00131405BC|nr:thioesterase family protein [Geodermatophilus sp. TF02-6]